MLQDTGHVIAHCTWGIDGKHDGPHHVEVLRSTTHCHAARLALLREIGRAVAALHDGGIIHGDLTTSNLLMRSSDSALVSVSRSFIGHTLHKWEQAP